MRGADRRQRGTQELAERPVDVLSRSVRAGVLWGTFIFFLEAVTQWMRVWPFFSSVDQSISYLSVLSLDVLGGLGLGIVVGLGASVMDWLEGQSRPDERQVTSERGRVGRTKRPVRMLMLFIYGFLLAMVLKAPLGHDLMRLAAIYVPNAVARERGMVAYFAIALLVGLIVMSLYLIQWLSGWVGGVGRWGWVMGLGIWGVVGVMYVVDGGYYHGLYETTIHRVLWVGEVVVGMLGGVAVVQRGGVVVRWVVRGAVVMGVIGGVVGWWVMERDEGVRALVMHRGVVVRRWVAAVRWLGDRDGDGFAAVMGGGDCAEGDGEVNPVAREVVGNGRDENCLGGDGGGEEGWAGGVAESVVGGGEVRGRNVVLITVDALRADHLGSYGYGRGTSPGMDGYGGGAVRYEWAYSPSTSTGHAFAAMVRSAYGEAVFDDRRPTFIQLLQKHGVQTVFVQRKDMAAQLNLQPPYRRIPKLGIEVDIHPPNGGVWTARELTDRALEVLGQLKSSDRHFIWVHYYKPTPPCPARQTFGTETDLDFYDSQIACLDHELTRLLQFLQTPPMADETLVILTSNHGYPLMEHGQKGADAMLYLEAIRVPLIIRGPGMTPRHVDVPVSLIDLAPTILNYLGLTPPPEYEGVDILAPQGPPKRPLFAETSRTARGPTYFEYAVMFGRWHLIYDLVANTFELYDVKRDPGERQNLIASHPTEATQLKRLLTHWIDRQSAYPVQSGLWSLRALLR